MKAAASGLHSVGKDLQDVASGLREGASTMRDLDMAATLRRLAEIEGALDARSQQLEKAIADKEAKAAELLKTQEMLARVKMEKIELLEQLSHPPAQPGFSNPFQKKKK